MSDTSPQNIPAPLRWLERVFASWRFPSFMLFVLAYFTLLLVGILLIPPAESGLGAFAADFKRWCFGYDPASGDMSQMYVVMIFVQPLVLGLVITGVWWKQLRRVVRAQPRALIPAAIVAFVLVASAGVGFATVAPSEDTGELPFPADSLRTALPPPLLELTDQEGERVDLRALQGRVVLVTAVYASCGYTCPMILSQAKRSIAALTDAERADLTVVGVTLDPERDTPEVLANLARGQRIAAPLYHLVTGEPAEVNQVLDDMNVARSRDPKTGVIDHTNLFILIDRSGHIAYRFSLGARQERWLVEGMRTLLREAPAVAD